MKVCYMHKKNVRKQTHTLTERERERERENPTLSLHWLRSLVISSFISVRSCNATLCFLCGQCVTAIKTAEI